MIQAVIFDMDGVLIDSEIVYLKHLHGNLLKKYPHVAIEELYPVVGATTKRTREIIGKAIGAEPESEAFIEYYNGLWDNCAVDYPSILRREVPGLLKELRKRGYALALASTTSRAGIEQVLYPAESGQILITL